MIININSIEQLSNSLNELTHNLEENNHLLIRGLFSKDEMNAARAEFRNVYSALSPRGTTDVKPHEIVNNDLLKFSIGQTSGAQSVARLFLILYRNEQTVSASEKAIFDRLVKIWEIFQGRSYTTKELAANNTFFAKRYQYYPVGGGFMGTHADTVGVDTSKKIGGEYYQFVLPMTQKGVDYTEGGGYIVNDGKWISNEDNLQLGDLIVYNGAIEHGVADIDPHKPLSIDGDSGRIVMFITLYKKMQ